MEPSKRKRRANPEADAGFHRRSPPPAARAPLPPEEDDRAVTNDEVEEFFAILSRMHEATRCLAVGPKPVPAAHPSEVAAAGARSAAAYNKAVATWSPTFAWEDFAGPQEASKNEDERGISGDGEEDQMALDPSPAAEDGEAENTTPRVFDLNVIPEELDGLAVASPRDESTARYAHVRA